MTVVVQSGTLRSAANVTFDALGDFTLFSLVSSVADYTNLTVGTGNAMVVWIAHQESITSVTWDYGGAAQALTQIGITTGGGFQHGELWGRTGGLASGAKTLRIGLGTSPMTLRAAAISFRNATTIGSYIGSYDTSVSTKTLNITSAANHQVVMASVDTAAAANVGTPSGTFWFDDNAIIALEGSYDAGAAPTKAMTANYSGAGNLLTVGCDIA